MTIFWAAASGMMVLALAFVVVPLFRHKNSAAVDRNELNVAVIKQKLQELDGDLRSGELGDTDYAAARGDLERELLDNIGEEPAPSVTGQTRKNLWVTALLVICIPVAAIFLYGKLGAGDTLPQLAEGGEDAAATQGMEQHSIEDMVDALVERLRTEPDDLEGWTMLGRSFSFLKRPADAVGAYANAYRLAGDTDPVLLLEYADAVAVANGNRLAGMPAELIKKALAIDPGNLKGLWLNGIMYFQQQEFASAIEYLERALAILPDNGQEAHVITQQLQQARAALGQAPADSIAASGPAEPGTMPAFTGIEVTVMLDPQIGAEAAPEDTVFIFARATEGPRMPLAIVRKQVSDLPVTVTLDDTLAMSPSLRLSNFGEVALGARVSKSGNATPQSGDLTATLSPVKTDAIGVNELIIKVKIP